MRNSFSLSVYFLLRCKCDVKIVYKISVTASRNMKLIPLILFISIAVEVKPNELFTFPPKFHPPNSGIMMSSDSSIYLPPESHTTAPYYSMKNVNDLPFPYLPHSGTKAPLLLPTPFPLLISSTLLPMRHDDDDDDENDKQPPPFQFHKNNRTERGRPEQMERRETRQKPVNYQPIDRNDMKPPIGFFNNNQSPQQQHNPPQFKATPRSMIISMDQHRNDAVEQLRSPAATYQGPQYLPAPNIPGVYLSSTTETAVPILRLSNEMDLDGSFSYEALGADQTHYVQHSRMENTGTDKEEQVVEGSYSYVGDNGQTYTVHYVADSKGFRASGDHLPVGPPIPEIIQRAVQFNLAEEAKRPPNQKSWNDENEVSETERYHRFAMPPTSRPLFTGKTPESFSFGFSQGAYNTPNLTPAANTQNSARINNEFTQDQMKSIANNVNNGPITPQVTFLASQGAHVPSPNQQQSISRVFTTERTILPQIVNYEAAMKEEHSDQSDNNKGLWRWQYGLNTNANPAPEKNSISRSSGLNDDDNVMINFGEMTSDQYTKMLRSQLEPNMNKAQDVQKAQPSEEIKVYNEPHHSTKVQDSIKSDPKIDMVPAGGNSFVSTHIPDWQINENNNPYQHNNVYHSTEISEEKQKIEDPFSFRSKIITQNNFVPQSQLITQSYDYDGVSYEPKRISRSSSTTAPEILPFSNYNNMNNYGEQTQNTLWPSSNQIENIQKVSTTETPAISSNQQSLQFSDFLVNENKNEFKPILPTHTTEKVEELTTTTESVENMFENNMFLKNLFKSNKNEQNVPNQIKEDSKNYQQSKIHAEQKPQKAPKLIQMQGKPYNDIKATPRKPIDLYDIMNYISAKNHFESIKIKPKSQYGSNNNNHRSEIRFIPVQNDQVNADDSDDEEENMDHNQSNHRTSYHPEELRGIIKNYKVLQRNNGAFKNGQDVEQLKRDLSPPPVKILQSNLPPLGRAGPSVKSYLPPVYI